MQSWGSAGSSWYNIYFFYMLVAPDLLVATWLWFGGQIFFSYSTYTWLAHLTGQWINSKALLSIIVKHHWDSLRPKHIFLYCYKTASWLNTCSPNHLWTHLDCQDLEWTSHFCPDHLEIVSCSWSDLNVLTALISSCRWPQTFSSISVHSTPY